MQWYLSCSPIEGEFVTTQSSGLYDRLGSVYGIATGVDDFIDRIMVDPRLNANPKVDEAFLRRDLKLYAVGGATATRRTITSSRSPRIMLLLVRCLSRERGKR
jgi:hypothetical protein